MKHFGFTFMILAAFVGGTIMGAYGTTTYPEIIKSHNRVVGCRSEPVGPIRNPSDGICREILRNPENAVEVEILPY